MKLIRIPVFIFLSFIFFTRSSAVAQITNNNTLLPNRTLLSFNGAETQSGIQLKGTLSASNTYDKIIIERGVNSTSFQVIAELPVTNGGTAIFGFFYTDNSPLTGVNYYRIRLFNTLERLIEISNILLVRKDDNKNTLEISNTVLQINSPTLTIHDTKNEEAVLSVSDMYGHQLYNNTVKLYDGANNFLLPTSNLAKGYAIVNLRTGGTITKTRIYIQ